MRSYTFNLLLLRELLNYNPFFELRRACRSSS